MRPILDTLKARMRPATAAAAMGLAVGAARGEYVLYDDFTQASATLDRAKWWRGGLAGVDGTNAVLNESDLTSSAMFLGGDFRFVIGGPSATSQGLFGLGDIDDGDPYLVLSDSGGGWRFHVRNGRDVYTGPVLAPVLAKGDVVVFHWDESATSVSINGEVKGSQATVHPPRMPLTLMEWNNTGAGGQIIMDSVSYSVPTLAAPRLPSAAPESPSAKVLSAALAAATFVDSSHPSSNFTERARQVCIRNSRFHPDLTGAGGLVDAGQLGLVQFILPPLPEGWRVAHARLAGTVAQSHNVYGMPGWAPDRPIELELLGLSENPDLATVTYNTLHDASGQGVIVDYTAAGSINFTFGRRAQSLEVLPFNTVAAPAGSRLQFPDRQGKVRAFVQSRINASGPRVVTFALGPGRTQAVSGMECDFKFYARKHAAGGASLSLMLELEPAP